MKKNNNPFGHAPTTNLRIFLTDARTAFEMREYRYMLPGFIFNRLPSVRSAAATARLYADHSWAAYMADQDDSPELDCS